MKRARRWLVALAAVAGVAATLSLAGWQLDRARQKLDLQASIQSQKSLSALDGRALAAMDKAADALYRPVLLQGRWLGGETLFLDNRQMLGKPGFYVVTPLLLPDGSAVAVQRGWVQRNFSDRAKLPVVQTPQGPVTVTGRMAPPPAKLYEFKGADTGAIRQNLDLAAFGSQTGLRLRTDISIQQTGGASEGLLRDWPEAGSGVEKHYGYAFQWFALAALIAILYAWFQFIAPRRAAQRP